MYNFDKIVNRKNSNCVKYDALIQNFGTEDLIPLWIADTDFETPQFIIDAMIERLKSPVIGYNFRSDAYFQSIIYWNKIRHNWDINREWLGFVPGVVPGLSFGVTAYTKKGDNVVIQPPVYPPFADLIKRNERGVLTNELKIVDGKWEIDFEDFENKIKDAKLFMLCNPHNPSGRVFTYDELKRMGDICVKYGVKIISDEIHSDLILPGFKHICISSISPEIANISVSISSPSKTFNIAGHYTSTYIIPSQEMREAYFNELMKVYIDKGNEMGAVALQAAYENGSEWLDELNEYVDKNVDYVLDFVEKNMPKIKIVRPESTFLLWVNFRGLGLSDEKLFEFIFTKAKLALNRGKDYGACGEGYMRLNIGVPKSVLEKAMQQLLDAYNTL